MTPAPTTPPASGQQSLCRQRRLLLALGLWPVAVAARDTELEAVDMLIPGPPGGGWDRGGRAIGQALLDARLARRVGYRNVDGGGGWRGLEEFLDRPAPGGMVMVQSLSLVARQLSGAYRRGYRDLRPLACLAEEYEAVVVRPDSPLADLMELRRQMAAARQALPLVLGSARGSVDHLAARLLLMEVPRGAFSSHRYAFRSGDSDATQFLLAGAGVAMVTGFNAELLADHQAGRLRILATSGPQRLQKDIPTWTEQGVEASFANWRGLFARRDMPAEQISRWLQVLETLVASPAWRDTLKANAWGPRHLSDDRFLAFLDAEERRLRPLVTVAD